MNIVTVHRDGSFSTRPDTTVERECRDFYLPTRYDSARVVEGVYVRIVKAGKAVGSKFTSRYLDKAYGKAYVIYGPDGMSLIDSSTILLPADNEMESQLEEVFGKALCEFSQIMSVRIGDIVILESSEERMVNRGDCVAPGISLR